jgi:hypothetical protein
MKIKLQSKKNYRFKIKKSTEVGLYYLYQILLRRLFLKYKITEKTANDAPTILAMTSRASSLVVVYCPCKISIVTQKDREQKRNNIRLITIRIFNLCFKKNPKRGEYKMKESMNDFI